MGKAIGQDVDLRSQVDEISGGDYGLMGFKSSGRLLRYALNLVGGIFQKFLVFYKDPEWFPSLRRKRLLAVGGTFRNLLRRVF
jgi:hypothetical protein